MSLSSRVFAPLRRGGRFLRPGYNTATPLSIFERDPFFAGLAPLINSDLTQFQQYKFPRVDIRESQKTYRIEAEVPGLRKDNIAIEFLDPRVLRVSGRRHLGKTEPE